MTRPLSPLHRPLEEGDFNPPVVAPLTRIDILRALDQRVLADRPHSLGPGGASALFSQAVSKALVDEMAHQLREGPHKVLSCDGEVRRWAKEIIEAFEGKG